MLANRIADSLGRSGRRAERERGQYIDGVRCVSRKHNDTWAANGLSALGLRSPSPSKRPSLLQRNIDQDRDATSVVGDNEVELIVAVEVSSCQSYR